LPRLRRGRGQQLAHRSGFSLDLAAGGREIERLEETGG
jgi:hypothetical protein